jgi:hypothetical protein
MSVSVSVSASGVSRPLRGTVEEGAQGNEPLISGFTGNTPPPKQHQFWGDFNRPVRDGEQSLHIDRKNRDQEIKRRSKKDRPMFCHAFLDAFMGVV